MSAAYAESTASYDRIISALEALGSRFASRQTHKVKAQCPAHEDREPSLAVDYKPLERKTLICCHAGCRAEDVLAELGLKLEDLYDEPKPRETNTRHRIPRARLSSVATPTRTNRTEAAQKKEAKPACSGRHVEVERYEYADANGTIVGTKIRRECSGCPTCKPEGAKPGKKISWERPAADGPGIERKMPEQPPLYRTPQLLAAPKGSAVYLGEGERVVAAAESLGLLATTKPGSAQTRWNPDHTPLLAGQHVVILADRDTPGYKSAWDARDALLAEAASVTVLQTPIEDKGADLVDHLAAGLTLADLVAVPEDDTATPAPAPVTLVPAPAEGEPIPGDDGRPNRRDQYAVRHGEIVKVTRKLAGLDDDQRPLIETNFDVILGCSARIVRVETRDLGDAAKDQPGRTPAETETDEDVLPHQPTSGYVIELVHPKHLDQPVLMRVTRKDFDEGRWLADLPWPNVYYRGNRNAIAQICSAIRDLSGDAVRVPVYAATGWRRRDDGWMYVHAGGAITASGHIPVHTRFPGRLALMTLPAPTTDPKRIRQAALASLSLPGALPEYAAVAMLGLVYRAPYSRCPSSICLTGLPGSGKTGVGTAILHHFAPELERTESLLSISDTGSTQLGATEVLYRMRDALIMGDDSAPDRSVRDAAVRTSRMGRTQYNGEGRIRLKSVDGELELDEQRGPRGSFIQTAEVLASTQSAQERMLTIQMARAELDMDALARVSAPETAQQCALLTASYIQWIAARYETLHREVRRLADDYAAQLRPYCGDRPAEHLGQFATGWHMLLRYLTESGAATAEETAGWWLTAWSALLDAADRERNLLENSTMHKRLLGYLATALNGKHCHLVGPDGKCPADQAAALRYGWTVVDNSAETGIPAGPPVLRAGGTQIGVVTTVPGPDGQPQERLWLDHQQATRIALRMAAELQEPFTVTAPVLTEALRQAGVIAVEFENVKNGRRVNPRRPMPGGRRRVWDMPATAVMGSDDDGETGSGTGAARPPAPPAPQADPLFDISALTTAPTSAPPPATTVPAPAAPPAVAATPPPPAVESAQASATAAVQPELPSTAQEAGPQTPPAHRDQEDQDQDGGARVDEQLDGPEDVHQEDDEQAEQQQPTRQTRRPWRAAAAVAHTDGLHLPDGQVLPLPPIEDLHAGRFALLVDELDLGHGGSARGAGASAKWRPDDGQIYITAALTEALGLPVPEDGPPDERRAYLAEHTDHPFLARARAEGWQVHRWGSPIRIWRERPDGGRNQSAQLVIVPHAVLHGDRFLEDDPAPAVLARRVQQLADIVGITYRRSPGVTGHELLRATRPKSGGRAAALARAEMPQILMEHRNLYTPRVWDRQPTPDELNRRYVLAYDARASYLSVCSSVEVGRGAVQHLIAPEFNPKIPGLWMAKPLPWEHWGTFDPFGPRPADGVPRPYATPTLAYAQKDLKLDIEITEAWVWPDHYRMLEPWYRQLAGARKALATDTDETVAATLKDVYTNSIGLFNSDHLRGDPKRNIPDSQTFLPYVQQAVLAAQQANLTRAILRVGETANLWPIAVKTDCLFYVVDDPDFTTAVPLKMEKDLGNFKPEGAAHAKDIFAHLHPGKSWFPTASAFTPAEDWSV
ncbi:hypothetical protein ACFV2X_48090 [Streptomyces sp. NPDC059679]|uniref:hypothetical protein n=1 Tax=Streptomyces sp. NPDC059679 TaxID=3346903 RepID=UPI00367B1B0E